jgi:F0F1-type ATP synthase delta subunit
MSDDRTTAYAEALFAVARSEGPLSEVEDELFRVAQVVRGNDELRDKLADPHIPVAVRQQIVVDLLGGKALPVTTSLVSMVVGTGRVRDLPAIVDQLVAMSAAEANKEVADMAELTINTEDITAALRKNLEGFTPDLTAAQVGRVLEVGDGIARIRVCPTAAVNELLEFESGTIGLALNLDEESIGAVVLGEVDDIEEGRTVGPPARSSRCRSATACSAGWSTPWASPIDGKGPLTNVGSAAWRSRPPASWAASPCTSRCRPASRRSTR